MKQPLAWPVWSTDMSWVTRSCGSSFFVMSFAMFMIVVSAVEFGMSEQTEYVSSGNTSSRWAIAMSLPFLPCSFSLSKMVFTGRRWGFRTRFDFMPVFSFGRPVSMDEKHTTVLAG